MEFTYDKYKYLLDLLKKKNYTFCNYENHEKYRKCVILRHDVDFTLEKALMLAKLENAENVKSTYFVLLSTNFYNVFTKESFQILEQIKTLGHEIGLHFDEKRYEITCIEKLEYWINRESECMRSALDQEMKVVSMHRPSKWILENNIKFKKILNSYSTTFIVDFKYLSDSRMVWKENVLDVIENENYEKLHILTHPFWYSNNKNETMKNKLSGFVNSAIIERYGNIKDNFRSIEDILSIDDLKVNKK